MVLAVAHPNPWSSASFYLPSQSLADSRCNLRKNSDIYELLGDVRVASPRLCDLGRTNSDLGRTTERETPLSFLPVS